jgi:hypothetical protein
MNVGLSDLSKKSYLRKTYFKKKKLKQKNFFQKGHGDQHSLKKILNLILQILVNKSTCVTKSNFF